MRPWWWRFLAYARPHRTRFVAVILLMFVGVGLNVLAPWPLKLIVDDVLSGKALPLGESWMAISFLDDAASTAILVLAIATLLIFIIRQAAELLRAYLQFGASLSMKTSLSGDLLEQLQRRSILFHNRQKTGDLVRRVMSDTVFIRQLVVNIFMPALVAVTTLVAMFLVMWQLLPVMSVLALGATVPLLFLMRWLGPRMTRIASAQHQAEADMMSAAEQTMSAVPLVQAFGRENHEDQRFRNLTENVITCNMRVLVTQLQYKLVVGFTTAVGTAVVMAVGGLYVLDGALSLGSLIIFLSYLVALYAPMETLAHLSSTYADSTARAQRVAEILDSETSPEEPAEPKKLRPLNRKTGRSVSFDDVTFGYAPEHPVIGDLSLDIGSGQTVALVGATGVGKTTLVSLIPRFFDPWSGRVLIDGVDVRSLRLRELRSNIAMVLQEPFLFPVTIAENIAYGRPDCSQQEIKDMALAANADEFIQNLPLGYETRIGERGVTLSGGQRQRIAIARALLYDAPILILDEPTAALDVENEALILEALDRLMAGRTTIIIAHRLSTIRKADFVVRLNDGRASIENNRDVIFSGHRSGDDFALGQSKL